MKSVQIDEAMITKTCVASFGCIKALESKLDVYKQAKPKDEDDVHRIVEMIETIKQAMTDAKEVNEFFSKLLQG